MAAGERRLVGWGAAELKFPGGLRPTVDLAKRDYRVKTFLVWHAVHGYWGGIDGEALATLFAEEIILAIRYIYGLEKERQVNCKNGPYCGDSKSCLIWLCWLLQRGED
jgi:hypothetical protein